MKRQRCSRCKKLKSIQEFETEKIRGLRKQCRKCRYEVFHQWQRRPYVRFAAAKGKAKQRGKGWSLSRKVYIELIKKKCFYCGGKLPEVAIGLDRVNNNRGYHKDNVVPCCTACNYMKNRHILHEQMVEIRKHLIKWRKQREQQK